MSNLFGFTEDEYVGILKQGGDDVDTSLAAELGIDLDADESDGESKPDGTGEGL